MHSTMPNGGAENLPGYTRVLRLWRRAARRAARPRLRAALVERHGGLPSHVVETIVDMVVPPQGELTLHAGW